MATDFQIRYTVRVLLVDQLDRLLLFQGLDPANPNSTFWFSVGGGIEEGETREQAAIREVKEETGLLDFELGPHVWNREAKYIFDSVKIHAIETWFFSRVKKFEIDISGFSEIEREFIIKYRWWSPSELSTTHENLTPRHLSTLFKDLLLNNFPKVPIDLEIEDHT